MTEPELQRAIVHIITMHLGHALNVRIFLFGSRATGQHTPRSDYDIGIDATVSIPLATLGRIQADLDELPVLPKIEVVDLHRVGETFRQAVLASAKAW